MATFPIISIIIPVYNTEKYIRECLDSILAQTYTDWEAILIDDGSPDNSGKICDEYAEKDKRVKVIHKKNGGLSDARNYGLDAASGVTRTRAKGVEEAAKCEFVTFIDRDDILKINSLQTFNNDFSEKTDIVMSRMDIINEEELIDRLFNAIPS